MYPTFKQIIKSCPADFGGEERAFVALCLVLVNQDALQKKYPLREIFNVLRPLVQAALAGCVFLFLPFPYLLKRFPL